MTFLHFEDPCVHCGLAHDKVAPGPCQGDPAKAVPMAYRSLGVRWDHVEHFRILFSDGRIEDRWAHISEHAAERHFGRYNELHHPPRLDQTLEVKG